VYDVLALVLVVYAYFWDHILYSSFFSQRVLNHYCQVRKYACLLYNIWKTVYNCYYSVCMFNCKYTCFIVNNSLSVQITISLQTCNNCLYQFTLHCFIFWTLFYYDNKYNHVFKEFLFYFILWLRVSTSLWLRFMRVSCILSINIY